MRRVLHSLAVLAIIAGFVFVVGNTAESQSALTYTCNPNGTYTYPTSGAAALTSQDLARAGDAADWLQAMTGTTSDVVTSSTIELSQDYAPSHLGEVSGSFTLADRTYPVINPNVITNVSPASIPNNYTGSVTGQVTMTPEAFRWIIQLYKRDASQVVTQVPVQALADASTGVFTISLPGGYDNNSEWLLGVLDANAAYAPYGPHWPEPSRYDGLEVQHLIVTDAVYYWSTIDALTNGEFTFTGSNTGSKMVRLVESATDDILAEYIKPSGLVRSYQYTSGETGYGTAMEERSFVYDQALALFAAMAYGDGDYVKLLADGLLQLQTSSGQHDGGFVFAAPQMSPSYTDALYRTGAHAIATDALLAFIEKYGSEFTMTSYEAAAIRALDFIDDTQAISGDKEGLYLGGYGNYSGTPQVFDANYQIPWASTEHNIDIWHAFGRAARVLQDDSYQTRADELQFAIMDKLYNDAESRLNQGYAASGPDTADPLDVNSWGAILLHASTEMSKAQTALARVSLFEQTLSGVTGYAPFYSSGGYPGATPTVWYEGSFGVVLAHLRLGNYDEYRSNLNNLSLGQEIDGSFRYATHPDVTYEIGISKSVASTAWFVLATTGRDLLWNSCSYVAAPSSPTPTPTIATKSKKKQTTASSIPYTELNPVVIPEEVSAPVSKAKTPAGNTQKTVTTEQTEKSSNPTILIVGATTGLILTGATVVTLLRHRLFG